MINVLAGIRKYWWEKFSKINKRTGTTIPDSRVDDTFSGTLESLNDDKCLKKETWTEICNKAGEHDEVGWDPKHNPRFDTLR